MSDAARTAITPIDSDSDSALFRLFASSVSLTSDGADRPSDVAIEIVRWNPGDPPDFSPLHQRLPLLVLPPEGIDTRYTRPSRVVVAAEGRDERIAQAIVGLLNPDAVSIDLVHVTWLPGIVTSPIDALGLDNPGHQDLLMYHGAREALMDRSAELRDAGFQVATHLRMDRHPQDAMIAYLRERPTRLFVLGLGRHGSGIGRDIMREIPLPLLFVSTRD